MGGAGFEGGAGWLCEGFGVGFAAGAGGGVVFGAGVGFDAGGGVTGDAGGCVVGAPGVDAGTTVDRPPRVGVEVGVERTTRELRACVEDEAEVPVAAAVVATTTGAVVPPCFAVATACVTGARASVTWAGRSTG